MSKEVEFVPVKTARLGTRIKARRVRRQSSPSPVKTASPLKPSEPTGFFSPTSQSQNENRFDYGPPLFDDQPGFAESTPGNSTKKKAGKVEWICFINEPPLTHFDIFHRPRIKCYWNGCLTGRPVYPRY